MRREHWNRKYAEAESLWSTTPNRFLVAEASHLEPGRALDLACGEGRNAIWLASRGWEVTGVDFVCADLLEYEPAPEAFGLVLLLYFHLPSGERRRVLDTAAGALSPGGTFLLIGHDLTNLTDGTGGPTDPAILVTPDQIVSELPGLEIEKAERVLRDVADADRPAIDALVRARRR